MPAHRSPVTALAAAALAALLLAGCTADGTGADDASTSMSPRRTRSTESPVASATTVIPPCPNSRASAPAQSRRAFSSR